jgi:RNA methyltransferase, TrmH family
MITSTSNSLIKTIRRLADRKERVKTGLFLVEGLRIVGEAVQLKADIRELIYSPDLLRSEFGNSIIAQLALSPCPILEVSGEVFRSISTKQGPQGIAAVISQNSIPLKQVFLNPGDLWVALDSIQDPGNLGTILRTLDAVGGKGVILLDESTDFYDPATVRGSMGSIFSMALVRSNLADFSEWKVANHIPVIGTAGGSEKDYRLVRYPDPMVLLMGSERLGLQEQHYRICDQVVKIAMAGRSDSLNLAVATGVVLYEVFYQRRG